MGDDEQRDYRAELHTLPEIILRDGIPELLLEDPEDEVTAVETPRAKMTRGELVTP